MSLLCGLGWHSWEAVPRVMELVKHAGVDIAFWSSGIQKGQQHCQRCPKTRTAYRKGMVGMGGSAGRWKSCSHAMEAKIDRLPVM